MFLLLLICVYVPERREKKEREEEGEREKRKAENIGRLSIDITVYMCTSLCLQLSSLRCKVLTLKEKITEVLSISTKKAACLGETCDFLTV